MLAGLLLLTVFVVTPFGGWLLLLFMFLGHGAAAPLIFVLATLGALLCLLNWGVLAGCGMSRGRACIVASFLAAIPVILMGGVLFLQPGTNGTREDTLRLGKQVALPDLRIVRGVPGCTQACVAGTLTNQGTESLAKVTLSLDLQDATGQSLGRLITPVAWTPAKKLDPGGTATFLYEPTDGLLGIDSRLARVSGEVVEAGTSDPSHGFARALARWVFRKPPGQQGEWYSPAETMRYARQVTVTALLESAAEDRYTIRGVVHNGGNLPLMDVSVAVSLIDSRGFAVAGRMVEAVRSYPPDPAGSGGPLTPGSDREFAVEIRAMDPAVAAHPPLTLQAALRRINLGRKDRPY